MSHKPDNIFVGAQAVALAETRGHWRPLPQLSTVNYQLAERQRSDYEAANRFLTKARREMANQG